MVIHSSILAQETLLTEELSGLESRGSQELDMTWQLNNKGIKSAGRWLLFPMQAQGQPYS